MLPGATGKPKFMLLETEDDGGGDGGGEDYAADQYTMDPGSDSSCPNQLPCIDCEDKCQTGVRKGKCTYECEIEGKYGCKGEKTSVKCSGDGLWDYV